MCSLKCGGEVFGPMAGSYLMLITPPSQAGSFLSMLSAGKLRKVLELAELPCSEVTVEAKHEAWKPTVPRELAPPHHTDSWSCSFQRAGSSLGTGARAMLCIVRFGLRTPGPQTCLA